MLSVSPSHLSPPTLAPLSTSQKVKLKELDIDHFLSRKYIGHLFGDSFVEDSLHEGWYLGDALAHMLRVLKENPATEEIIQVTNDLENCLNWHGRTTSILYNKNDEASTTAVVEKAKADLIKNIEALKVGEHTVFPGGCMGHSVIYEVGRTSEEDYSFVVYNTGTGIYKHWTLLENEGTQKVKGAYKINQISIEKIIEGDFLDLLIQLKGTETSSFGEDLYEDILPLLEGTRESAPIDQREYMRAQRSGTCAWKVLLAYLRYHLPFEQYKYLKLKMRLDVFDKWSDLGRDLNFHTINQKLLNRLVVNYEYYFYNRELLPVEFSKEELLCLALLKVQKTFNRYSFLLSPEEKEKAEGWYEAYTNQSIYDYHGSVTHSKYETENKHFLS